MSAWAAAFLLLLLWVGAGADTSLMLAQRAWTSTCVVDAVVCANFLYRRDGVQGIVEAADYFRAIEGVPPLWAPHWIAANVTTVEALFASPYVSEALVRYRGILNSATGSCNDDFEDPEWDGTKVICVCQEGKTCSASADSGVGSTAVVLDSTLVISALVVALVTGVGALLLVFLTIVCKSRKL